MPLVTTPPCSLAAAMTSPAGTHAKGVGSAPVGQPDAQRVVRGREGVCPSARRTARGRGQTAGALCARPWRRPWPPSARPGRAAPSWCRARCDLWRAPARSSPGRIQAPRRPRARRAPRRRRGRAPPAGSRSAPSPPREMISPRMDFTTRESTSVPTCGLASYTTDLGAP